MTGDELKAVWMYLQSLPALLAIAAGLAGNRCRPCWQSLPALLAIAAGSAGNRYWPSRRPGSGVFRPRTK
jgi:hypothetical protein